MKIVEAVLDGFKSYSNRVVVGPFDEGFNAICGMNGTGKSNILDGICFVLGITNLDQVRVKSMQGLIYKDGQAGVTTASVSIVFNNELKKDSPIGYEHCNQITVTRQIMMGGKNKYKINGRMAQVGQISNLFQSVQLNINNPHFLIMQGRINKVIQAKPKEILAMVEEAAGTRMFETKKAASLKTLEKKDGRLAEIQKAVDSDITPQLEKLRSEKSAYLEWTRVKQAKERNERVLTAYDHTECKKREEKSLVDKAELEEKLASSDADKANLGAALEAKEAEHAEVSAKKNKHMQARHDKLEIEEKECKKELVQATTVHKNKGKSLKAETGAKEQLQKEQQEKAASVDQLKEARAAQDAEVAAAKEALAAAKTDEDERATAAKALAAGLAGGSSDETLGEVIENKTREASLAATTAQKATMRLKHESTKKAGVVKASKAAEKEMGTLKSKLAKSTKTLQKLEAQRADAGVNPEREEALGDRRAEIENQTETLKDREGTLRMRGESKLNFQFTNPESGFDRSKVKGCVAKLVTLKDKTHAAALEVAAGGKLYQVVVDSAETSKKLLKNGKLRTRVTIVPLDKVGGDRQCINPATLDRARRIGEKNGANVDAALSLVEFERDMLPAMQYAFGNALVCDTKVIDAKGTTLAEKVCFELKTRTVTADGDLFDPSGTLSGGSRSRGASILAELDELSTISARLDELRAELGAVTKELTALSKASAAWARMEQDTAMAQKEVELLQTRIDESRYGQLCKELAEIEEGEVALRTEAEEMQAKEKALKAEVKDLQKQSKEMEANRAKQTKELDGQIAAARKATAAKKKTLQGVQAKADTVAYEIEALEKDVESAADEVEAAEVLLTKLAEEVEEMADVVATKKAAHEAALAAMKAVRDEMTACERELAALAKEISGLESDVRNFEKKRARDATAVTALEAKARDYSKKLELLEAANEWIAQEKAFFGRPGTDYDFEAGNIKQCQSQAKKLSADEELLRKKINHKVMGMIEKAEADFKELKSKRDRIMADRKVIESTIAELDHRKNETLDKTWKKVNKDFGSIFSILLPGTRVKLEPPEGKTVMDGLEVKIAFGQRWKESLVELSGGQRALLALSLILSLLLFKPAPMYILDEVDAALDLSHTQNVGTMLRTHFSDSQFIVVSHKEGMFNNANAVFHTKLVNNVSTVTRTVGAALLQKPDEAAAGGHAAAGEDTENSARANGKGKGKSKAKKARVGGGAGSAAAVRT